MNDEAIMREIIITHTRAREMTVLSTFIKHNDK